MKKLMVFSVIFTLIFSSCVKYEGKGGNTTVMGKVYVKKYNSLGQLVSEYYAQRFEVFIVYGADGVGVDDRERTSYDGSFKFPYLRKGVYKVFVYSKCPSCPSGREAIIQTVEVSGKTELIDLGTIEIRD
ncbi:MAG: hypothetical protein ACK4K0_10475 [Flavobacteriales bacterium]